MAAILDNLKIIFPFFALSWTITIASTLIWPYKYRNAVFLMGSLFFTLVFIAGFFGKNIGSALLVIFLLCVLALLLVPFGLMINGIVMIIKEGISAGHLLSLCLGVFILIGELSFAVSVLGYVPGFEIPKALISVIFLIGSGIFYISVLLLGFVFYMLLLSVMPPRRDFDYIIIHGCGLRADGTVTKLLANRLDKAIAVFRKSTAESPMLIPSGGQGADECRSEAAAMCEYLLSKGIPAESVILEDRSTTTLENLQNSKAIIEQRGGGRTVLVTSNYHVYRCLYYARQLKMKCSGIGAKVASYYWPSAVIREFVAFITRRRILIPVIIGFVVFSLIPALSLFMG